MHGNRSALLRIKEYQGTVGQSRVRRPPLLAGSRVSGPCRGSWFVRLLSRLSTSLTVLDERRCYQGCYQSSKGSAAWLGGFRDAVCGILHVEMAEHKSRWRSMAKALGK